MIPIVRVIAHQFPFSVIKERTRAESEGSSGLDLSADTECSGRYSDFPLSLTSAFLKLLPDGRRSHEKREHHGFEAHQFGVRCTALDLYYYGF